MKNEANCAALGIEELKAALAVELEGWRTSSEAGAFFSQLPRGGWLKIRFCSRGYKALVKVTWCDGRNGSALVTHEHTTALGVVQQLARFKELHEVVVG